MKISLPPHLVGAISVLAFAPASLWAQVAPDADRGWGCGQHMGGWGGWYGMIFGPLMMILVLACVVAVVMLVLRWLAGASHGVAWHQRPPGPAALDILKARYARGEINQSEFEERRRVLGD